MPILTEVRFAHDNGALADTLTRLPGCTVSVIQETSTDPEGKLYFMEFDCETADDVEAILESDDTVDDVRPMPGFEERDLWGVAFAPGTKLMAPRVTNHEGFVLEAHSTASPDWDSRGWRERWLLPDRAALQDIWQYAREEGFVFDVIEFRQHGGTELAYTGSRAPTEDQREALVAAYEQGYFADPRETSLEALAESLDLSQTAVAGRLRRGMKATLGMTLAADESPDQ